MLLSAPDTRSPIHAAKASARPAPAICRKALLLSAISRSAAREKACCCAKQSLLAIWRSSRAASKNAIPWPASALLHGCSASIRPTPDVIILQLRFPAGTRAKFRAGQYLRVIMADGDSRNFSMANPPHESDSAELHIRHVPGGRFSEEVLTSLATGDKLEVEVPFGEFFLREDSPSRSYLLRPAQDLRQSNRSSRT